MYKTVWYQMRFNWQDGPDEWNYYYIKVDENESTKEIFRQIQYDIEEFHMDTEQNQPGFRCYDYGIISAPPQEWLLGKIRDFDERINSLKRVRDFYESVLSDDV